MDKKLEAKRLYIFAAFTVVLLALMTFLWYKYKSVNLLYVLMLTPAISAVLARLITKEGTSELYLKPRIKGNVKWYLSAYFATPFVVYVGAVLFFLLYPNLFDMLNSPLAVNAGVTTSAEYYKLLAVSFPVSILISPIFSLIVCFGEEFGWRGYLFPKLCKIFSVPKATLLSGVIWGLWHAPLIALGYNYGASHPVWGVLAMIAFSVVGGIIEAFLLVKTQSIWAGVLFHAAANSIGNAAPPSLLFMSQDANPFIGPDPTGIVGGIGLVVVAAFCFVGLCKGEKPNTNT